jgi:sarcosine oxidase
VEEVFEAIVVGAGMFGSAAAKYLGLAGCRTLLIGPAEPAAGTEADRYSFGAYFDEARITRRLGWDDVWGALDARSLDRYQRIEAESGVRFFHECGSLVLMATSIARRTSQILARCQGSGIAVERASAEELGAAFPALSLPPLEEGEFEGLLERSRAGYVNPRRLVEAQLALATKASVLLRRAAVTDVRFDRGAGRWRLQASGLDGEHEAWAEKVLVATGAFTNHNGVLPADLELALHAFTEPNLLFEVPDAQLPELRRLPPVVSVDPEDTGERNASVYLLPPIRYPDGKWYIRIGPGMQPIVRELRSAEEMTAWYARQRISSRQERFLTRMARTLLPGFEPASVRHSCCIIEKTPSRYPYIGGLAGFPGLSLAVGGNGHGARGSDEIGRLAAATVLAEGWSSPVPRETFTPMLAADAPDPGEGRAGFLTPPFGLC